MRGLPVVSGLTLAVLGSWWVLHSSWDPDGTLDPAGPLRPAARPPLTELPATIEIPRVGVVGPADWGLVAQPEAGPWEQHCLTFSGAPGDGVSGAKLLEAIGERLYVRARSQADLDAFRLQVFAGFMPGEALPLIAVKGLIERAGWQVSVGDSHFVFRPADADELARAHQADLDVR